MWGNRMSEQWHIQQVQPGHQVSVLPKKSCSLSGENVAVECKQSSALLQTKPGAVLRALLYKTSE